MSVRVRLFAALRDAAGVAETTVQPGALVVLLDELCTRFGDTFRARLQVAAVLLDGETVSAVDEVVVSDGAELALLPPVSGGA